MIILVELISMTELIAPVPHSTVRLSDEFLAAIAPVHVVPGVSAIVIMDGFAADLAAIESILLVLLASPDQAVLGQVENLAAELYSSIESVFAWTVVPTASAALESMIVPAKRSAAIYTVAVEFDFPIELYPALPLASLVRSDRFSAAVGSIPVVLAQEHVLQLPTNSTAGNNSRLPQSQADRNLRQLDLR